MRRRSHGSYLAPAALFLAFILLFLTCVSVPFAQGIRLFTLIDRHTGGSIRFGLWGYCLPKRIHGYPPCTMPEVGWTFNNIPTLTGLENSISPQLTGSLFIHPVVTAAVFIIFVLTTILVSKPSFQRKLTARLSGRSSLHVVATTFTLCAGALASVAFIMDVVVIARVKSKVNRASGTAKNMKAHTGVIAWLSFIATIILWVTSVLLFLLRKKSDSRRSRRSMDDDGSAYDSDVSLRRTDSDARTVRSSYSRQVTDHSVHSRSASAYVSRGEDESEMVEDRDRGSRRSVYTEEAEDNPSEEKRGFLASLFPCLRRNKDRGEDEYEEDVELETLGSSRSVTAVEGSGYLPDSKSRSVIATDYDSRSDIGGDLSGDDASRYSEPVDAAYISNDRTRSGRSRSRSLSYAGSEYTGERPDDTVGESTAAYRTEGDDVDRTRSRIVYSRDAKSFEPSNAEREISADASREVLEGEHESQPTISPTVTPRTSGPYDTEREHSFEGVESGPVSNDGVSRDVQGDEYGSYANTEEDVASRLSPSQQTPRYVPSGRESGDLETAVLSTDRSRDVLDSSELDDEELRESTQVTSRTETEPERAASEEDLLSASRAASSVPRSEGEVVSDRASQSGAPDEALSVEQGSDISTMEPDSDAELSREVSVIPPTPTDERGDEEYDSSHSNHESGFKSGSVTPYAEVEDDTSTMSSRRTPSYAPSDEEMSSAPASDKGTELLEGSTPTPISSSGSGVGDDLTEDDASRYSEPVGAAYVSNDRTRSARSRSRTISYARSENSDERLDNTLRESTDAYGTEGDDVSRTRSRIAYSREAESLGPASAECEISADASREVLEGEHESQPKISPTVTPRTSGPYDTEREHSSEKIGSRSVSNDGVSQDVQGDEDGSSYADTEKDDASQLSTGQQTPSYVPSDSENGSLESKVLSTDRSRDVLDSPEELRESTQVNSRTETEPERAGSEEDLLSASRTPTSVPPSKSNVGSDRASQSGASDEALSVEQEGSDLSAVEPDSDAELSREVSVIPPTPSDERHGEEYDSAERRTQESEVTPISPSTTSFIGEATPDRGSSVDDHSRGTKTQTDAPEDLPVSEATEMGSGFGSPPKSRSRTQLRSEYSPVSEREQSFVPENDESGGLTPHSNQDSDFKSGSVTPYTEAEDDARTMPFRRTPSYMPSDEEMLSLPASDKGAELLEGSTPTPISSPRSIDTNSRATASQAASQNLSDRFTGDYPSPPGSVPQSYQVTSAGRYTTPISPRDWDEGRNYSAGSPLPSETEGYTSKLSSDPRTTRMSIQPSHETDRGGSYVPESTPPNMVRSPSGKYSEGPVTGTFSEPQSGDDVATREYPSFSPSPEARTSLEGEVPNSMTPRSPSYIYSRSKNGDEYGADPMTSRMSIQPSYETDQGGSYVPDSLPRGTPSMVRSPTQRSLTGQYSEGPMTGNYNSEPRSASGALTGGYGSLTPSPGARTSLEGEAQNFATPRPPSYPISGSNYGDDYDADPRTSRMSVRPYETNNSGSYLPASPPRGSSAIARSPTRYSEEPTTGVYYPDPRSSDTAISRGYSRYTPSRGAQTSFEGEIPNYGTTRASSYPASGSKYGDGYESGPKTSRISTLPYTTDYRNSHISYSPPLSSPRSPIRRSPIRQYSESPVAGSYYSEGPVAGNYSEGPAAGSYYSGPRSGNISRGYGSLTPSPGVPTSFEGEVPNYATQSRLSYEPYSGSNYGNDYTDPRNSRASLGPPYETDYRGSYVPASPSIGNPRAGSFTRYSEEPMTGSYYPDSKSGDNALVRGYSRHSPTPARTSLEGDAPIYSQPRSPSYTYSGNKYDDEYATDSTLPVEPVYRTDAASAFVPDRQSSYNNSPSRQYTANGNYSDSYYPEANDRNSNMPGGVLSDRRTAFEPAGDEFASRDSYNAPEQFVNSGIGTTPTNTWRDSPELSRASYEPPLENPDAAGVGSSSSPSSSVGTIRGSSLGDTIYPEDSFLRGSSVEGITEPGPDLYM